MWQYFARLLRGEIMLMESYQVRTMSDLWLVAKWGKMPLTKEHGGRAGVKTMVMN